MAKTTTIKTKLLLLITIPTLAFLAFAGNTLYSSKSKLNNTNHISSLMELSSDASQLVFNLQRERGLSIGYIKLNDKSKIKELLLQREKTNQFINLFKENNNIDTNILNNLRKVNSVRKDIKDLNMYSDKAFDFYTNIIDNLLEIQNKIILVSNDKKISQMAQLNTRLLIAIENAGQERAIINGILSAKKLTIKEFQKFSFVHIRQAENLNNYKSINRINDNDIFSNIKEYNYFTSIILDSLSKKVINADANQWWKVSTKRIDELIRLYVIDESKLTEYINENKNKLNNIFLFTIFFILVIFIIMSIWLRSITEGFLKSLNSLSKGIEDFILFVIYRDRKVSDIQIDTDDEIGLIAQSINKNIKLLEACFRCDERVIQEVSKAVKNAKNDIDLVEEIKCFADNIQLENMKFDFNEMIEIIKQRTKELDEYKENLESIISAKTTELEKLNDNLQVSYKVLEDEKIRLSNFSGFLSGLNSVDVGYLANKTLQSICNVSGAMLGFFMVYEKNTLKVLSSQAINKHTLDINEEFITSSPLIMESLQDNKIIDIEDIGEDSLESVDIGFAQVKLNSFYSFPLVFQDKPLGVIVLASAKNIDKDYLQGYIHALTSSLNNATSYNYIQQQSLKLEQANLELKESDQMKSEFLANMSHELRTPLNSVIGFSGILVKNRKDNLDEKQVDQVGKINRNGKHLLDLINNILDLSKIESGKMELDPKNIDIVSFVSDTVGMLGGQADSKKIDLHFDNKLDKERFMMKIDESKLRQILLNIIGNALKFVEISTGRIIISTQIIDSKLNISIKDNGIGIPEDKLELIFEAFRQVDGSTTRKYGGTGLGLAISKNMTALLGGDIEVSSVLHEGSVFNVILPLDGITTPVNENNMKDVSLKQIVKKDKIKSILIIDDTQDSRDLIQEYVEDYDNIVIYTAKDGEEGLIKAREIKPSLITLDIMMPKINGWEVLKSIENDDILRDIPVIIISNVSNKHKALSLGATACLNKPISKSDLTDTLKQNFKFPVANVLIIDDEPDIQDMMVDMISDITTNVKVASNGKQAYDMLEAGFKPEVIFLDLMMPEFNGFDFLNMIKYQDKYKHLNIIVVSAKDFTKEDFDFLNKRNIPLVKKGHELENAVIKALEEA